MRVIVNGRERDCDVANLADLWRAEAEDLEITEPRGFAIALNGSVVSKGRWSETGLATGDRVEIIRAFAGG